MRIGEGKKMTASEGKISISLGFPRAPQGTEVQTCIWTNHSSELSSLGKGNRHSDPGDRDVPPKINKNQSTPRHWILKLANSKEKEKILKAARDKRSLTFMGRNMRLTADLSRETWQARKGRQDAFRILNEMNLQPRLLYPARLSSRIEGEIKSFQDRQELKEYVTTKPALQEIQRGTL